MHNSNSAKLNSMFAWSLSKQQELNLIRWIDGLLNGGFDWGRSYLYNSIKDCHCALGVAAEVFGFKHHKAWRLGILELHSEGYYFGFEADSLFSLYLIDIVPEKWYRSTFGNAMPERGTIARWSDSGLSFAGMAARLINYLPESREKTELSYIIADKLELERSVRERTVADDGLPSEGYFNHP